MNFIHTFRLKTLLLTAFMVPLLLLMVMVGAGINGVMQLFGDIDSIYKDRVIPLKELYVANGAYSEVVVDSITKAHVGLIDADAAISQITKAKETANREWHEYLTTYLTPQEKALSEQANKLFGDADAFVVSSLARLNQYKGASVKGELGELFSPMYASVEHLSQKIDELIRIQLDITEEKYNHAEGNQTLIIEELAVVFTISFIISIFSLIAIMQVVKVNVGAEPKQVNRLVGDIAHGDLNASLFGGKKFSPSSIAGQINEMKEKLRLVVGSVSRVTQCVDEASCQVSEMSRHSIEAVKAQQDDIASVYTAMTQMQATVSDIASNASQASDAVAQTNQEVIEGNAVIDKNSTTLQQLLSDLESGLDVIKSLAERVEGIGSVLNVIDEIAEQTNLLALNAAIEAARAGDYGRGFAVVADEVRSLAQRTNESTKEIQDMIETLQQASSSAVSAMTRSGSLAQNTLEHSSDAKQSLLKISESVKHILDMSSNIATAAEEQSIVASDINRNVAHIQEMGEKTVVMNKSLMENSQELTKASGELKGEMAYFSV